MKSRTAVLSVLILLLCVGVVAAQDDEETVLPYEMPPITDYYSLCAGDTDAEIFSWHGVNQDGKPPVDLNRQAMHFFCVDKQIYAPHAGVVWGETMRYGGLVLVDDDVNDVCMVFLGLDRIDVEAGDVVSAGTLIGRYLFRVHFAALDGDCEDMNWYDFDSRAFERPIAFIEIGEAIATDLRAHEAIPFRSENPAVYEAP